MFLPIAVVFSKNPKNFSKMSRFAFSTRIKPPTDAVSPANASASASIAPLLSMSSSSLEISRSVSLAPSDAGPPSSPSHWVVVSWMLEIKPPSVPILATDAPAASRPIASSSFSISSRPNSPAVRILISSASFLPRASPSNLASGIFRSMSMFHSSASIFPLPHALPTARITD